MIRTLLLPTRSNGATPIAPVSVIQNEFSMMERSPLTDGTLEACAKHGIGFTPYMPLASGFLSGQFKPGMTYKNDDIHRTSTWFTDENLKRNQPVLTMIDKLASEKNATYSQIALAYLMHKYDRLVPIPGMYEMRFVKENIRAAEIELTAEDMQFIDSTLDSLTRYGDCKEDKVYALGDMLKEEGYVIGKSWREQVKSFLTIIFFLYKICLRQTGEKETFLLVSY